MIRIVLILCVVCLARIAGAGELGTLTAPGMTLVGVGFQDDGQHWSIRAAFGKSGAAIAYPSLPCVGQWTPAPGAGRYAETILDGTDICIPEGEIVLSEGPGGTLFYAFSEPGGPVIARALLVPAAAGLGYMELLKATLDRVDLSFVNLPAP